MGKLKLTIVGDKNLDLCMDDPSESAKDLAVKQAFALFGVESKDAPASKKEPGDGSKPAEAMTYQAPPRPVYPTHVINDTKTNASTMKQAVQEIPDKETPEFYKTGIKIKHGVPHYRCRYQCPKCAKKANHYIPQGTSQVDCHECQTSMTVTKSIKGATLLPDKFGNHYVAGDQQPVLDLTYANQKEKIDVLKKHNLIDKDYKGNV